MGTSGTSGPRNPTAIKRWFVFTLRQLREAHGLSRSDAAQAIRGTVKTLEHIEVGRRLPTPLQLDKLLEIYAVPERTDFFQDLLKRAKVGTDWWARFDFDNDPDTLPEYFKLFLGLESEAEEIDGWDAQVAPGLLQTRNYAEAVVRASALDDPSEDNIARLVELRMARRAEVLDRVEPPTMWRVIHENALRLPVGGREVQREQLEYLLTALDQFHITLQVLPASAGAHTGVEGAFTFLTFTPDLDDPGLVHAETHARSLYYERPEELATYRKVLRRLHAQALPPEQSPTMLRQILKET